jgi:hypothetical protein
VHCDITGQVVLEHLSSAFAGAIDRIVTARPATKIDGAFISISFQFEDNNFDRSIHFVLMESSLPTAATPDALDDFVGVERELGVAEDVAGVSWLVIFEFGLGHPAIGPLHFGPHGRAALVFDGFRGRRSTEG